ncbi:oxidoreductase [Azospirillum sp. B510]|nr:oxidoreductase [Azospirillum sp. B510]
MAKRLDDKVVVITGASSGIGRATALEFARQGAVVILAARRMAALHEVAEACIGAGGRAMVVPTDVTDQQAVRHLADRAIEAFGGIDIWVNNAGVIAFGRFEDIPDDVFEQVLRTDLLGTVHGCRAVLPHFLDRGEGIVINTASMVSNIGQRYATPYTAAKFAVRGFSESLRQELVDEPGIHVCMVMPASIDTPLWRHAANYTGRALKPLTPVHPPEEVADAILSLARHPRRERFVGTEARIAAMGNTMAPHLTERALARNIERDMFQNRSAPATSGGVMTAMPEYQGASGGWIEPGQASGREQARQRVFSWTNLSLFLLPLVLASRPLSGRRMRPVW